MNDIDPQAVAQLLNALLQPWRDAVNDPAQAQRKVLQKLSIPSSTPSTGD